MSAIINQPLYNDDDEMASTHANFHFSARDAHICHGLSPTTKLLFLTMATCAGLDPRTKEWTIYGHDYAALARKADISESQTKRAIKLMAKHKCILVTHHSDETGDLPNSYILPSKTMWKQGRIEFASEKLIIQNSKQAKENRLAAFHPFKSKALAAQNASVPAAYVPAVLTAKEQEVLDSLGPPSAELSPPAPTPTPSPAPAAPTPTPTPTPTSQIPPANGLLEDEDDDDELGADYVAEVSTFVRYIYEALGREDVPADLLPAVKVLANLTDSVGSQTAGDVLDWAISDTQFWRANLIKANAKVNARCPIAHFAKLYDKIKADAESAWAKDPSSKPAAYAAPVAVDEEDADDAEEEEEDDVPVDDEDEPDDDEPDDVKAFAAAEDAKELARQAAEADAEATSVIDLTTCDSDALSDGTDDSKYAYLVAARVYRYTDHTTVTKVALDNAASLLLKQSTENTLPITFNFDCQSVHWACITSDYWKIRIKESHSRYKSCPVAFMEANWEDNGAKIKISHQAANHSAEFLSNEEIENEFTVKNQADETAAKSEHSAKKTTPPPATEEAWDEEHWKRRYAEAEEAFDLACQRQHSGDSNRWFSRMVELDEEKAAATGVPEN